jgi:hypothetical protein
MFSGDDIRRDMPKVADLNNFLMGRSERPSRPLIPTYHIGGADVGHPSRQNDPDLLLKYCDRFEEIGKLTNRPECK